jgi:PAS domain S-box-containing protein
MKITSIKQKLIIRNMVTLVALFSIVIVIFLFLSNRNLNKRIDGTSLEMEKRLKDKGRLLTANNAYLIQGYIDDNSINTVGRLLKLTMEEELDLIQGGLVAAENMQPWAWLSPETPEGIFDSVERLENETTRWAFSQIYSQEDRFQVTMTERKGEEGRKYYDFAAPFFVEDFEGELNFFACLIYTFSNETLLQSIDAARKSHAAEQRDTLFIFLGFSILVIVLGYIATRQQAVSITQPLNILTSAADTIASGHYGVEVEIKSNDELEILAYSFNQMARDLEASYEDLFTKNRELEEARNELEEFNKHLEEMVEERTKQLRESESKFRTLFNESADAILLTDKSEFLDCNPAMLKMMGCNSKGDLMALRPEDISPILQPDQTESSQRMEEIFEKTMSKGSHQFEWLNKRINGEEFYTEIVITSFPLNGKLLFHMVFRDITERKVTEDALKRAQDRLVETAHSAGMAEIATGVLHNIGNILNSVNISTEEIATNLKNSKMKGFLRANEMLSNHKDNYADFFTNHPKGKLIPEYFLTLEAAIKEEHLQVMDEIDSLTKKVGMMRDVISTQQNYAKSGLYTEDIAIEDLIEDSLKLQMASLHKQGVRVIRNYQSSPRGYVAKVKMVHVLTNLIKNSKEAMAENKDQDRDQELELRLTELPDGQVEIRVMDTGCGIKKSDIDKIFNHGYTTKADGHGFGLHTCANFMTEMNGSLQAESRGDQNGACFIVKFPISRDMVDNSTSEHQLNASMPNETAN